MMFINNSDLSDSLEFLNNILPWTSMKYHYKVDSPGVYIVTDSNYQALYIGEAKNIFIRLRNKNHPIKKKIPDFKFEGHRIFSIIYYLDEARWRAETILIGALKPIYNDILYLHSTVRKNRRR